MLIKNLYLECNVDLFRHLLLIMSVWVLFLGCSDVDDKTTVSDKVTVEKRYHKTGKLAVEFSYDENHKYHGEKRVYYENGKLRVSTNFIHGLPDGEQRFYRKQGVVGEIITYKRGERTGVTKRFYNDGQLLYTVIYKKGLREGKEISYYNHGQIKYEVSYSKGHRYGKQFNYSKDDKLTGEMEFEIGLASACYEYLSTGKRKEIKCSEYAKVIQGIVF